jgi:glucose-1-phosphate adenylyltransferase
MIALKLKVFAYDFARENDTSSYWRDIGTRDSYYQANMDLCGAKPKFNLYDKSWPLRTHHHHYPPLRVYTTGKTPGTIVDSLVAGGCVLESGQIEHSVVSNNVVIKDGVLIKNSVIMDGVTIGKGAQIQGAIIDKDVDIPAGTKIGFYPALDRQRFVLTTSGIVIVAKKTSL